MEPFLGSAAVRRGDLTRHGLNRHHRAIYRDVYLPRDVELTARLRAQAAWLATGATLCGLSAAAVLGSKWIDASEPAEISRADRHRARGIVAHSWALNPDELCVVDGLNATNPARTAFDIGRTRSLPRSVPILDALIRATGVEQPQIAAVADRWPSARGIRRLRSALELVDGGAESPQETRLRLIIIRGGLPKPETQIWFPELRIRVDLGWRQWMVAIEYDGMQHWTDGKQRAWDIERIALLEAAGWVVVRVSAAMLARPEVILERIRGKLRAAGCPL